MATDKTFSVAGISSLNGEYKVRFANDMMRIKVLAKSGHEDIRLADLEGSVTKLQAAAKLLTMDEFSDATAQATITEYIEENTPKAKATKPVAKTAKTPQVKAIKGMTPLGVTAPVTENEDAPF
jgi:hypothetical protein